MFTIEIKINGRLLSCITGKRLENIYDENEPSEYSYECYTYQKDIIKDVIKHKYKDGIHKLVRDILTQVLRKMGKHHQKEDDEKETKELEEIVTRLFEKENVIAEYDLSDKLIELNIPNVDNLLGVLPQLASYPDSKFYTFAFEEREFIYTTIDYILKTYDDPKCVYSVYYGDPNDEDDIECFFKPILAKVMHFYPEKKEFIKKFKKIISDYKKNN